MAVNTADGTVVYDVAFALVWVEDGDILNATEAYAFASCTDCAAVAVGFQVVLWIGQVDVAVPENIAAAVNYACVRCATYALATQLVVTLPAALSEQAAAELDALWAEIAEFAEQIDDVPLDELQDRLGQYEARIVEILERESATVASATDSASSTTVAGASTTTIVGVASTTVAGASPTTTGPAGGGPATTVTVAPTTTRSATTDAPTPATTNAPGAPGAEPEPEPTTGSSAPGEAEPTPEGTAAPEP
ncbi:MAG: hypothetical protein ACR2HP_02330 [Ilumatobacteraceae bacterium]